MLKDGPLKCGEIAAIVRADVCSLFRLMRALSGLGIFAQTKNEYFALLPLGENLRADIPGSLKAIIITLGEIHYQACGALLHAVQEGSPAFDKVFGAGLFEYLDQNTDAANSFNEGMASLAGMLAYAVVLAYDLGRASSIVNVGGGNGRFLETILEIYPEIQGTVFERLDDRAKPQTCRPEVPSLLSQPHETISREKLVEEAFERPFRPLDRSVDMHLVRLRRKLESLSGFCGAIRTVRSSGYMFVMDIHTGEGDS